MPTYAGPGLGHHDDWWNPETKAIQNTPYTYNPPTVAGSSTTRSSDSGSPSSSGPEILKKGSEDAKDEGPSFDELFAQVQKSYAPVLEGLNQRIGELPGQLETRLGGVGESTELQRGMVTRAEEEGTQRLGGQREEAADVEKSTLRDLQQDVMNLFQAGNQRLGSMGASDSSAAEMLKFAIAKQGSKRTTDVVNTTRKIFSDIDNLGETLKRETQNKLASVEQWKLEQEQQARDYIDNLRNQLLDAKGNINASIGSRQIGLIEQEYIRARSMVDQLNTASIQMEAEIADDYRRREADLNDYREQMGILANYTGGYATPGAPIEGLGAVNSPGTQSVPGTPMGAEDDSSMWQKILDETKSQISGASSQQFGASGTRGIF